MKQERYNTIEVNNYAEFRYSRFGKTDSFSTKKADLTQEQLSSLCHVSTKHLANIEKGIMNPSYEILLAIFRVLPVSLDALILPRTAESECELKELNQNILILSRASKKSPAGFYPFTCNEPDGIL